MGVPGAGLWVRRLVLGPGAAADEGPAQRGAGSGADLHAEDGAPKAGWTPNDAWATRARPTEPV